MAGSEAASPAVPDELRGVLDTLPCLVWTASPDGQVDSVNRRWCEYTGVSFAESCVRWHEAIHAEDLPALLEEWRRVLACGESGEVEARLRRFDGQYRRFLIRSSPLRDAAGRIVKWYGVNYDIEDQTRAEYALRARALDLRTLLDSCPIPVVLMSAAGELEAVNRHVEEYFGRALEELKNWETGDSVHPDDIPRTVAVWGDAWKNGHSYELEHRFRRADGVYRWFHVRGLPLRDTEGRIARWVLVLTDIDNRKQAEALLADENRLLEMIARGCSLPVVLDALCELVERSTEGVHCSILLVDSTSKFRHGAAPSLPSSYNEFIDGQLVQSDKGPCAMAASMKTQVIASDLASDSRWSGSEWQNAALALGLRSCWSTPIFSSDLKVLGTFAIYQREPGTPTSSQQNLIRQFTQIASIAIERVRGEAARRLSEEALDKVRSELTRVARVTSLGALTASIAHEVNQPLSGVITNASTCLRMLGADPPNVEGALETARRTIRDGNRAADVIARLRALFGKQGASAESVDLNEAAREVIALSSSELQRRRVILHAELDARLPPITGDRVQLQQVILNLLLNAMEAMNGIHDRPRTLLIRTELEESDRVRVSVQDSGMGFDPQGPDKLFEAFYTTKDGGMGIGLSVSRSIIERHHGRLWAAPNDGPGATFSFSIPRVPEVGTDAQVLGPAATAPEHVLRNP